jgi:hypothetical protein
MVCMIKKRRIYTVPNTLLTCELVSVRTGNVTIPDRTGNLGLFEITHTDA